MYIGGKDLMQLRVQTEDGVLYKCRDLLVDGSGKNIKAFVINRFAAFIYEYIVPVSNVKISFTEDLLRLNLQSEDMGKFHFSNYEAKFGAYYCLEPSLFEYSFEHEYGEFNSIAALEEDGRQSYFSLGELSRYKMSCEDAKLGQIRDVFVDPYAFTIGFFAVAVNKGFTRKWAFVSSDWMSHVDWGERTVHVEVERAAITAGPLYKPRQVLTEDMELSLNNHNEKMKTHSVPTSYQDENLEHYGS